MRRLTVLLSSVAVMAAALSCSPETSFADNPVIAHRGAWLNTGHPQNSLASFRAAAEMGCHGSECDVWFTSEDSLVIFHDARRNGKLIEESTFEEIRAVPLSNGELVPTMREYIAEAMKQNGTKLIIDVKTIVNDPARTIDLFRTVNSLVVRMGADEWVEYLAGYLPAVTAMSKETSLPIAYLGQWNKDLPECAPDNMFAKGISHIDFQDQQYHKHPEWLQEFRSRGFHKNVWTVDAEDEMRYFMNEGFEYITTNEPELLLAICK